MAGLLADGGGADGVGAWYEFERREVTTWCPSSSALRDLRESDGEDPMRAS